jgi:hypothetical protein
VDGSSRPVGGGNDNLAGDNQAVYGTCHDLVRRCLDDSRCECEVAESYSDTLARAFSSNVTRSGSTLPMGTVLSQQAASTVIDISAMIRDGVLLHMIIDLPENIG